MPNRQVFAAVALGASLAWSLAGSHVTAAAGAQRTGTAFARLLQASHAADVSVVANGNGQAYDRALARVPDTTLIVAASSQVTNPASKLPIRMLPPDTGVEFDSPDCTDARASVRHQDPMLDKPLARPMAAPLPR